jgi:hypothetical protein
VGGWPGREAEGGPTPLAFPGIQPPWHKAEKMVEYINEELLSLPAPPDAEDSIVPKSILATKTLQICGDLDGSEDLRLFRFRIGAIDHITTARNLCELT